MKSQVKVKYVIRLDFPNGKRRWVCKERCNSYFNSEFPEHREDATVFSSVQDAVSMAYVLGQRLLIYEGVKPTVIEV